MKKTLILSIIAILAFIQAVYAKTIVVDVHGMTCALCVDTLNRKFHKMEGVLTVKVSMKMKKVQLETEAKMPTVEMIKQAVLDAGFTPVKITVFADDKVQK